MADTGAAADRLHELLNRAVRESVLLEAALERETRSLSTHDVDALQQAVNAKHQAVQGLEEVSREQAALLHSGGFAADTPGMEACLRAWDLEGRIRPLWERLQDSMERCRRHNQINGGLVQTQQHQVQQALHILRGEDTRTELYDPRGRTVASSAPRSISQA
ncbi:flagella synthesis protein FlgN [Thioalkalivibrio sp.]|uniref:flagella synthesis protein FlgN n=1 Tax=Thioalkalivibrio sp. TaxID=2093813 RepID=UPI0035613452